MEFKNNEALMLEIQGDLTNVVDYASNKTLELMKQHIQEIVYDPYHPRRYASANGGQRYGEEGGFIGSWTTDISYDADGNTVGKIYSDPTDDFMKLDPTDFVHGHPQEETGQTAGLWGTEIDRREIMDEAIAEGTHYDFYMVAKEGEEQDPDENWWTRPRDYFSPTTDKLDDGLFEKYVEEALKEYIPDFEKSFSGNILI